MEPVIGIETLLLRTQLPEVTLRPGTSVVARVLSRGESHGVLVIAGIPLSAQLPAEVGRTGETLRLTGSAGTSGRAGARGGRQARGDAAPDRGRRDAGPGDAAARPARQSRGPAAVPAERA